VIGELVHLANRGTQVGLANVGKSTLFQAITRCQLGNPANFPYATIDPEEARVIVPDERYDWLCDFYKVFTTAPSQATADIPIQCCVSFPE
jgi:obg-like ATPase 1